MWSVICDSFFFFAFYFLIFISCLFLQIMDSINTYTLLRLNLELLRVQNASPSAKEERGQKREKGAEKRGFRQRRLSLTSSLAATSACLSELAYSRMILHLKRRPESCLSSSVRLSRGSRSSCGGVGVSVVCDTLVGTHTIYSSHTSGKKRK